MIVVGLVRPRSVLLILCKKSNFSIKDKNNPIHATRGKIRPWN
jgi:hypothetical protein